MGEECSDSAIPNSLAVGLTLLVRVVDCHAGVLGSYPGGPKRFSPWNYFRRIVEGKKEVGIHSTRNRVFG